MDCLSAPRLLRPQNRRLATLSGIVLAALAVLAVVTGMHEANGVVDQGKAEALEKWQRSRQHARHLRDDVSGRGRSYRFHASIERLMAAHKQDGIINRIVQEPASPYAMDWPNTLAVCAVLKLETPENVREFLEFYKYSGVDKIYLQENDSATLLTGLLAPYVAAGFVEHSLKEGPVNPGQSLWYNECAERARADGMSWVAFLDLDEFAVVLENQQAVTTRGALKRVLSQRFRYNAAVSLQWVLFGSNQHTERPAVGQMRGYTRCTGALTREMKCVGNTYWLHPDKAFQTGPNRLDNHVHDCSLLPGATATLADGTPLRTFKPLKDNAAQFYTYNGHLPPEVHDVRAAVTDEYSIVINHYVTRSMDEFIQRKATLVGGGKYGMEFRNMTLAMDRPEQVVATFAEFERRHGFDTDDDICKQGAKVAEAAGLY